MHASVLSVLLELKSDCLAVLGEAGKTGSRSRECAAVCSEAGKTALHTAPWQVRLRCTLGGQVDRAAHCSTLPAP